MKPTIYFEDAMVLPLALGLLGSGLAGAGALGALSPLIAGALGTGVGSAVQEGSLEEGIKSGLGALALGGIGGALTGGAAGAAGPTATSAGSVSGPMSQSLRPLARPDALGAAAQGAGAAGGGGGIMGTLRNMPSGFSAVGAPPGGAMSGGLGAMAKQGLQQGVMTGAGLGTATYGAMDAMRPPEMEVPEQESNYVRPPNATREYIPTPAGYRPGVDPEHAYFSPSIYSAQDLRDLAASEVPRLRGGGMVEYRPSGMGTMYMQEGGLADMAGAPAQPPAAPQMNEKELVQMTIRAVRSELPEETAAIVLGQFVREFGEDALRKLVDDVQSGKANGPRGDVTGPVKGPGDGMDDLVPATMDDGSQDVLLSNDEYVVDAPTVAMLGNGSSEAGARILDKMREDVRQKSVGRKAQPNQIDPQSVMPA